MVSSAARALGQIGSEQAVPALTSALHDRLARRPADFAEALGSIGSKQAVPALIRAVRDGDYYVRIPAALALGRIGSERAIPTLIQALHDRNDSVRENVIRALGSIGSEKAVPVLIQALQDSNDSVRETAAIALAQIDSEQTVSVLIQIMEDGCFRFTRGVVVQALGSRGGTQAVSALIRVLSHERDWALENTTDALCRIASEDAIPELIYAFDGCPPEARQSIFRVLASVCANRPIPSPVQILRAEEASGSSVLANAIRDLRWLGDKLDYLARLCEEHGS